jgi:hypothetical protein
MKHRAVAALVAATAVVVAALPTAAFAHGDKGELYVPWTDSITEQRALSWLQPKNESAEATAGVAAAEPLGTDGLTLVGNSDKDGTTNSDLAFWENMAFAGNYGGFRILDIRGDSPRTIVDYSCNGPQNDVSVHRMGGKLFLFQSIDSGQTREDCSSANAPIVDGRRTGYEGVRVFDVTNPAEPKFLDMIQTACGSHTHTLIPNGRDKAVIYVSSYPLGSGITDDSMPGNPDFRPCKVPHKKISVIQVSAKNGEFDYKLREQPLSDDTAFNRGFQACHDIQILESRKIALASCAGDAQLWDISDPMQPTANVEGEHTHIYSPSDADQFEFIHSGVMTWDGQYMAIMDETGGGVTANCFGSATTDGFYYFYKLVEPGDPAPALESRYSIPRDQGSEVCVSHNASVVPVRDKYVMSASYYQGGVTVVDFTDVKNPHEVAFADLEDATGSSDEWSSYWYNGRIYSNSGLGRRGDTANRGVDVYAPGDSLGLSGAKQWSRSNPQTQESWQAP